MRRTSSPVRGIAALMILLVITITVFSWWGEFKAATRADEVRNGAQQGSSEDTAAPTGDSDTDSAEPTSTGDAAAPATPKTITVLVDGLNLRIGPSDDSDRIRSLDAGTKLTYMGTEGSWFKVKDPDGKVGYISSNSQYSRAE